MMQIVNCVFLQTCSYLLKMLTTIQAIITMWIQEIATVVVVKVERLRNAALDNIIKGRIAKERKQWEKQLEDEKTEAEKLKA